MSSTDGFSVAKTLIRTVARTFFTTRQILVIDALFTHSVLHADDLAVLFSSQAKDIRKTVGPLLNARLMAKGSRQEAKVGSVRHGQREYYYIPLHPAIDAIKYKITRLRKKAVALYEVDEERKDYKCPRCKAEWTELEVLDKVGPAGFECHRCGTTLEFNEDAGEDGEEKYRHEKLKRLNAQLEIFDGLTEELDKVKVPENDFETAWARKVDVPRTRGSGLARSEHVYLGRRTAFVKGEGPGETDASRLQINISSGADQEREEEARKEARRRELAKQNQLPEWHTSILGVKNETPSKIEAPGGLGRVGNTTTPLVSRDLKKGENVDSKNGDASFDADEEMRKYIEDMAREKAEAERKAELEDAEDDEDYDEDDGEEFEDVATPSFANTPVPSQSISASNRLAPPLLNGLKRNSDYDVSEVPSEATTPTGIVTPEPDQKRIKLDHSHLSVSLRPTLSTQEPEDSEEGEDFEDAM